MKISRKLVYIASVLMLLATFAASGQKASSRVTAAGGKLEASDLVEMKVTVVSVDQTKREVVVKYDDGVTETLEAGDAVKRLNEIKAGDKASIQLYRSLALSLNKTAGAKPSISASEAQERTKPTQLPGGAIARQLQIVAKVTAIDAKAGTVTLTGPKGNSAVLDVDPEIIKKLKVDDLVDAVYTEAVAVAITRGEQPAAKNK